MIKFEEFDGSDQLESDPNRKHSERISDRIYESIEQTRQILVTDENQYHSNEDDENEDSPATYAEELSPQQMDN